MERKYWIGVDIGGTFTDAIAVDDRENVYLAKTPTTPQSLSVGVMRSLEQLAEEARTSSADMLASTVKLAHATTATVNAMVQRRGAKTGLITTHGFKDHLIIMKAGRGVGLPDIEKTRFSRVVKPEPLVPYSLTEEVTERVDYAGRVVLPLDVDDARRAIQCLLDKGVESIAVSFLWSFKNPAHERRLKELIQEMAPNVAVSLGSELIPVMGEYERTTTTVVNSFLAPILDTYVHSLQSQLTEKGLRYPVLMMQSDGGLIPGDESPEKAATSLLSGLAAGVIGVQSLGEVLGHRNIITIDMGGTSFEVGMIFDGTPLLASYPLAPRLGPYVSRWRLAVPTIDITAIGAGGGSIAWLDEGVLRVGPVSAGAEPGPVCYDKGGTEPTVTDALMVLGHLNPEYFLGGRIHIDREKAYQAIKQKIADPLGMDALTAAAGIYEVTINQMGDLMRKVTVERGYDPRQFVLVAFGGSGPIHSSVLGEELGVSKVIVPGAGLATAQSAFGLQISDLKCSHALTDHIVEPIDIARVNRAFAEVENVAVNNLRRWGVKDEEMLILRSIDMRYRRQTHEVNVPVPSVELTEADLASLYDRFEAKYEMLYGKGAAYREAGLELVTFRAEAVGATPKAKLRRFQADGVSPESALKGEREVYFTRTGGYARTPIYDGDRLRPGNEVTGPAVIEYVGTTVAVHPGQRAKVDVYLNLIF
jgi:N-methylhydantoinase A